MSQKKNTIIPMSEKDFLAQVYGGAGGAALHPFDTEIFLLETHIAGLQYREGYPQNITRLKKGAPLTLVREPENEYDELAILILDDRGAAIGYVPMERNPVLARLMDAGKYLYASVVRKKTWNGMPEVRIAICMRDYAPVALPASKSGRLLPKPEHPVRTDSEAYRHLVRWSGMLFTLMENEAMKNSFPDESPSDALKGDLVCLLMSLLKTDMIYLEEDVPAAYDLVSTYLEGINVSLPDRLYRIPQAGKAVYALLHGELMEAPETMLRTEAVDRQMTNKNLEKGPYDPQGTVIFYLFSLMSFTGANFLSIYNHAPEGRKALDRFLKSTVDRMGDYAGFRKKGIEVTFDGGDLERLKEPELYVGTDGLKGWVDR